MSSQEPAPETQEPQTHEIVARAILPRFPDATMKIEENITGATFDIYFGDKLVLSLHKRGARYFFPSRRKRAITWERVTPAALPRVIEYILRDLAQADYVVLSTNDKEILKRPIHISRYKRCPQCGIDGGIKIILRAESVPEDDSQLYTPISRSIDINGAEIKCTLCDWIGIRGELIRRSRRPRSS